jgi:imidazolonepropionase-like amidohydrolase
MAHPPNQASPPAADLVIRDVTVVSTRDGSLQAHQDVAVSGDRIVSVGPASPDDVHNGARAVDADGKYLIPGFNDMHQTWRKAAAKFASFPASSRQTFRTVYATLAHLACLLDAAGVRMLAGSDSGGAAWEVPGIALHQEFDELAQAGLPPLRILQMTTWDAAEFLEATDIMGTVDAGQHADLVLLDANPVESAEHLHRIAGVVRGGRYYGPADLDAIKDGIAASQSVS